MSHHLKGYTAAEYFKLYGTLPADVIEELLTHQDKLDAIQDLVENIEAPQLEKVDWYEEFKQSLFECGLDVDLLGADTEAKQGFDRLKQDLETFEKNLGTEFKAVKEFHTKLTELL